METYSNQIGIRINKDKIENDFLQISNSLWNAAAKELTYSAFKLYLELASNANGFIYYLSPALLTQRGLFRSKGTVTKARQELEQLGYIENNVFYLESKRRRAMMSKEWRDNLKFSE